jgi:phage replication O-like protein O
MASPQLENGYTRIANAILEQIAQFRIPGECMQCVIALWRKTYGHQKKEDKISISQWHEMTKIKKPNIVRALSKLITNKIIIRSDNSKIPTYRFNKKFDEWIPFIKKDNVIKSDNESLSKVIHTKERKKVLQKKNPKTLSKKSQSNPDIKILIDSYHRKFMDKFKDRPLIQAQDAKLAETLLRVYSIEKLNSWLDIYFQSQDPFVQQNGYKFSVFHMKIQQFVTKQGDKNEPRGLSSWTPSDSESI